MLVVDPRHWLDEDGDIPGIETPVRRNIIRIAQMIEYGAELNIGEVRETLLVCRKRPKRKKCSGLLIVTKLEDDSIYAFCPVCNNDQTVIREWQETRWAEGMPEPVLFRKPDDCGVQWE